MVVLGTLSMLDCNIFPGLGQDYLTTEVNMFLLPVQENDSDDGLTKAGLLISLLKRQKSLDLFYIASRSH